MPDTLASVVGGAMEYLPLIVILGAMSACAIAAYELFDWIERDEYERPSAASLGPMMQDVRPDPDAFDSRIRGLEARLSRLEHECDRIGRRGRAIREHAGTVDDRHVSG